MDVFLTRHGARIDKEDRQETTQNFKVRVKGVRAFFDSVLAFVHSKTCSECRRVPVFMYLAFGLSDSLGFRGGLSQGSVLSVGLGFAAERRRKISYVQGTG